LSPNIVEIGEELELDDGVSGVSCSRPSPRPRAVRLELSIAESSLKLAAVHRTGGDLEIDLDDEPGVGADLA
jgi:hypothetical protein